MGPGRPDPGRLDSGRLDPHSLQMARYIEQNGFSELETIVEKITGFKVLYALQFCCYE